MSTDPLKTGIDLPAGLDQAPAEGVVRLLCWNIAHRQGAWARLLALARTAHVDVAMLQEASRPRDPALTPDLSTWPELADKDAWHTWDRPDSPGRRWCSAFAWFPWSRVEVETEPRVKLSDANWDVPTISHPGQFAVTRVSTSTGPIAALVSIYGLWDAMPGKRSLIFAEPCLHRSISDLTPLLLSGEPVVIAGDLNLLYRYPDFDKWKARSDTVFARFATYGVNVVGPYRDTEVLFPDCPCEQPETCRHVMTRPDPSGQQWQLDYVLSNLFEERLRTWVLPIHTGFSDHAPIIIDLVPEPAGELSSSG